MLSKLSAALLAALILGLAGAASSARATTGTASVAAQVINGSLCASNVCVGDQVQVMTGYFYGQTGQVVDTDNYQLTATIYLNGIYLLEDVRYLNIVYRPTYPPPIPNYPRNCPYGWVYDIYRGCIQILIPYPRPYPGPIGYPEPGRVYPNPYPQPYPPRPYPGDDDHRGSYPGKGGGYPGGQPRPPMPPQRPGYDGLPGGMPGPGTGPGRGGFPGGPGRY